MKSRNLIGLDLGTGAVKGVLWNETEGIVASAERPIEFLRPAQGMVEIEPDAYEECVFGLLQELAQASSGPVDGIAMAAASGNTLLCDEEGKALTPIISWLDTRLSWCPPPEWNVREVTGWPALSQFPLMHLEYFRREMPDVLQKCTVAMNNDWLCWRLCGVHALDYSNATPFYLCNQAERCYEPRYLDYYGLSPKQLPALVATGTRLGTLEPRWAAGNLTTQTAVVAGSFDHPAAARAAGITQPGELLLSCGTSWVGFLPYSERRSVPLTMLCDPYLSQGTQGTGRGCWGGMFSVAGVGLRLEEFIVSNFGQDISRYEQFNDQALLDGTPAHAFALELLNTFAKEMKQIGIAPQKAVFCGGPSKGKAWAPLLEKTLGIPIIPSPYRTSTGAVGAAMIALQGVES